MLLPYNSVVLVADGRKMLLLRNVGDAFTPQLEVEVAAEQPDRPTREIRSDAPGRASGIGSIRSAIDETDLHQQEEDRFAADAGKLLNRKALDGDFETLFVVAPPRTLGELRKQYHKEVTARLKAEVPRDLTGHPVDAIGRILVGMG